MRFNKELNERAKGKRYEDLYESMLAEVQAIQRQYPNEKSIPRDHEFWRKKEELFDLVEMHGNRLLDVVDKDPPVVERRTTFRNKKGGTVKNEVVNGIDNNNQR